MQKKKAKLIVNPNADLGRAWRLASDLRHIADEYGGADWSGTVYPTHAIELAQQAGEAGYEMVIAVGGDGTVHEVVNGLMQLPEDRRPRLGVVPMGSGNDFAKAAGIEISPYEALRKVFTGQPRRLDIGRMVDDRGRIEYWDNTLGLGFDATVTIRSRKLTYLRGFVMYFTAVLQTIILNHEAAKLKFESDQETWEELMLMLVVCNGPREGGGFMVAPEARPDDGIFHYAAVRKVSRPMMLRLLPEVMNGTHGRFRQVRMGQCKNLTVESDIPFILHTDGEIIYGFGANVHKLSIEILPQALEVIT
jgi:diacylglycerol kinase (ATP)